MGTIVTLAPLGRGPSALCSQCRRWRRPQGADDQRWDLADPPRWIQTQREYLVEAAGVELSSMLTARKLLILGTATTAKRPHCPTHCTFIVRRCSRSGVLQTRHIGHSIPSIRRAGSRKTPSFLRYRKPPTCHFRSYARLPLSQFPVSR